MDILKRLMIQLETTREVMNVLGGNGEVARLTSSTTKAVSNWKGWTAFPANTYTSLIKALREKGYDAPESLWAMKQPEAAE